jgi:hypothetical protein
MFFTGRSNLKPSVRDLLKQYGDLPITQIQICRQVIQRFVSAFIDVTNKMSFRDKPHDKLFHLYLIATLSNGISLKLEKNEDINLSIYDPHDLGESAPVRLNEDYTLNGLLNNTLNKVGQKRFYTYDAFSTNCQLFIMDILTSNNFEIPDVLRDFILQDVAALSPGWVKKLTHFFTSLASRGKVLYQGASTGSINNIPIVKMNICRTIISKHISSFKTIANLLKTRYYQKSIPHDNLFKIFFVFELENGEVVKMEKQPSGINIEPFVTEPLVDCVMINVNKSVSINDLLTNAVEKLGQQRIYNYDNTRYNATRFIIDILESNGLGLDLQTKLFVLSDITYLAPDFATKFGTLLPN